MTESNVSFEELKKIVSELGDVSQMSQDELKKLHQKLTAQLTFVESYMNLNSATGD